MSLSLALPARQTSFSFVRGTHDEGQFVEVSSVAQSDEMETAQARLDQAGPFHEFPMASHRASGDGRQDRQGDRIEHVLPHERGYSRAGRDQLETPAPHVGTKTEYAGSCHVGQVPDSPIRVQTSFKLLSGNVEPGRHSNAAGAKSPLSTWLVVRKERQTSVMRSGSLA